MQLTFDQYLSLLALAAAMTVFGFFSYHCGLRDRAEKIKSATQSAFRAAAESVRLKTELSVSEQRAETNARAVELLNDELAAANAIKQRQLDALLLAEDTADAYMNLTAHMKSEIEALGARILTDQQRKTVKQAAAQLLMTAQIMEAMQNQASAKTQRTLAQRLQSVAAQAVEPAPSSHNEAA